jgi:Plectin/S10 domain
VQLSRAHAPRRLFHPLAEGVCYAEKDYNLAKHPEMDVPNLHVRIALLTLHVLLP